MTTGSAVGLGHLHHIAYVAKDPEATRQFYEDVLGLPLVATWTEVGEFAAFPGRQVEYCHTFFQLDDGSALAFFSFADEDVFEELKNRNGIAHAAIAVTGEVRQAMEERLQSAGYTPRTIDHGYCQSLYVSDPNGMVVEFTSDAENIDEIDAWQRRTAKTTLANWLAGDRKANNDFQQR
jgi:glyoxylase I family protein